jgi:methylenetetrahydrofolate reductase (NADPH)
VCLSCGAYICRDVQKIFAPVARDITETVKRGIKFATHQCEDLLIRGAPGIHFFSLNKTEPVRTIWKHLRGPAEEAVLKNTG